MQIVGVQYKILQNLLERNQVDENKIRLTYDYDPDTGILEVNMYRGQELVLRETLKGEHAQDVLEKIRKMKDKKSQ